MKMERKTKLKASALLTILICSIGATILLESYLAGASKSSYDSNNMTVSGVLSTDSYVLFPFQKKNVTIGFSKYGEMIDYDTKVGLDYNGTTDPWAPNSNYVAEYEWVEGWVVNITYWHEDTFHNTWAFALYSDYTSSGIGGDWNEDVQGGALNTSVHGGRKTNGGAITDPIKVLYNGPREFVVLLKTTIYESSTHAYPILSITFTIVFDKVKKQAIWFKDIKRVESPKRWGDLQVEFAERGQWDLESTVGERTGSAPTAYASFYVNQSTVYNHHYQGWYNNSRSGFDGVYDVVQVIDDMRNFTAWAAYWPKPINHWVDNIASLSNNKIYTTTSTVEQNWTGTGSLTTFTCNLHSGPVTYPRDQSLGSWSEAPMVFIGNNYQVEGSGSDYTYDSGTNTITFTAAPGAGADIRAYYKVGDGNDDVPGTGVEPCSPFTNAEWCFDMDAAYDMFRVVTVFGITDRNNGDDVDRSGGHDILDAEAQYYLNETFNPYDLYSAAEKQEYRWLNKTTLTSTLTAGTNYTLTSGLDDDIYQPNWYIDENHGPTSQAIWTGYNFSKSGDGTYDWLNEYEDGIDAHSKNWVAFLNATTTDGDEAMLKVTPGGYGVNVTGALTFNSIVDFGFWYYALSGAKQGPHIEFELYDSTGQKYAVLGAYANSHNAPVHPYVGTWTHYTLNNISKFLGGGYLNDADHAFYIRYCPQSVNDDLGTDIQSYDGLPNLHSWEWFQRRLGSFYVGSIGVSMRRDGSLWSGKCYIDDLSVAYITGTSSERYERVYNMEEDKLVPHNWTDYNSFAEKVLINGTLAIPYRAYAAGVFRYYNYTIDLASGNITFVQTLSPGTYIKILYSTIEENDKGRYEWIVVGKDGATIDSIGAAYITEAFDSIKDIDVKVTGMDVNDTTYGPYAPYVMSQVSGSTPSGNRAYYRDSLGRPHLKDDWCNSTPIASSDMIFEGGPIAQLGTEYFNEFTSIFFASSAYVVNNTGQSNKIMALSCWAKNSTGSGYATIGIYEDLNGTIGLVIWGFDGQDTYYASQWFWSYPAGITCSDGAIVYSGIEYLQHENRGVTSIMLEITYPTADTTHPTVAIVERCGTISEKDQHDP
jgi:hypothetical protein